MQCYSELLPPSGVTHSVPAAFTSPTANNLIVAKTSVLQIFNVHLTDGLQDAKLSLVAEYSLQGVVTALDRVKPLSSKWDGDNLLLAFRDAKLSLIEWDPIQHSISTVSIHYYENHDLSLCPWSLDLANCPSHLIVDPSSRCAAFNFSTNRLAIIPFHQAGDDLALDDDMNGIEHESRNQSPTKPTNGDVPHPAAQYGPSFVLPLTVLDPSLVHPIAMTFLHEYREPAFGVLFSTQAESMNMSPERRDILSYAVYTLDIDQKASTTLLSITKLPNDLYQVFAVPGPIGGSLLIGGNELIHIDQGGRANAIGVNEFSKVYSSFPMTDQPELQLRLENCKVQTLSSASNDILLILKTGNFAVLSFRVDGRSVSGLSIRTIDSSRTSSIFQSTCSTISNVGQGFLFVGSEESDTVLIGTTRPVTQLKRQISRTYIDDGNGDIDFSDDDIDDDDEDDDIYGESNANGPGTQGVFDSSSLTLQDRLHCLAPFQDVALGRPIKRKRESEDFDGQDSSNGGRLDLVLSSNKGADGCLVFMARSLRPNIVKRYKRSHTQAVWALSTEPSELDSDARPFDDMLIASRRSNKGSRSASLLTLGTKVREASNNDFEKGDVVIAAGRLASGSHVVVYSRDVRAYNKDFALDQIFAIVDEEADATAEVVAASLTETHILILKSDRSIVLLKTDTSGDLDEVELPDNVPSEDIISANLYDDRQDFFDIQRFSQSKSPAKNILLTVFTKSGSLSIHPVSNLGIQVFNYSAIDFLPSHLSPDQPLPKHWRNKDALAEVTICALGSQNLAKPYLVIRHATSDVTIYEPYRDPEVKGVFRFIKVLCHNGDARDIPSDRAGVKNDGIRTQLVPLHDVGGASVVFVTGRYPVIINKPDTAMPRAHSLDTGPIQHVSSFHDSSCNRGFVYVDENSEFIFSEIPSHLILDFAGWSIEKVDIREEITSLTYYSRTGSYVLATSTAAPFQLPRDDEWHPEWEEEHEKASSNFLPTTSASSLKLISSSTHSVISQHHFQPDEHILSVKCLNLEISEQTHERKDLIVVGTAITKGENVVTRGMLYLFDIVDVVPHPDIPETDLKLKLITKEDVRGACTAISGIGSQGFLLAAQGQKCMVRGLREDNAILPVAFLDMRYYVSIAKELAGTGLTILADAFSGLWLVGYSEEPYKMQILGRDLENPSIIAAEFLPQEKQLYIIASSDDGNLRILQYDPENPKTERGSVLLQRSNFNTAYFPSSMTLLPRSPTPSEAVSVSISRTSDSSDSDSDDFEDMQIDKPALKSGHQILMTTKEGAIALITPLSEASYRRLSTLQTVLTAQLDQPCGLNPRAHRQIETDGVGGRGMIDGQVVKRWMDQSSHHKYTLADRVGGTVWDVRGDMEIVVGAGLGYS